MCMHTHDEVNATRYTYVNCVRLVFFYFYFVCFRCVCLKATWLLDLKYRSHEYEYATMIPRAVFIIIPKRNKMLQGSLAAHVYVQIIFFLNVVNFLELKDEMAGNLNYDK